MGLAMMANILDNYTIYDASRMYHLILSILRPVFHQIQQILYTYNSLRCTDFQIWRPQKWWHSQQWQQCSLPALLAAAPHAFNSLFLWCGHKLCPNHAHPLGLKFILGRFLQQNWLLYCLRMHAGLQKHCRVTMQMVTELSQELLLLHLWTIGCVSFNISALLKATFKSTRYKTEYTYLALYVLIWCTGMMQ